MTDRKITLLSDLKPRDIPIWRARIMSLCESLNQLQRRADQGEPFESLRTAYEGQHGLRDQVRAIVREVAGWTRDDGHATVIQIEERIGPDLTSEDVYLGFATLSGLLRAVADTFPTEDQGLG